MFRINFYLNRFIFNTEITKNGIYSLHIEKILTKEPERKFIEQADYISKPIRYYYNKLKEELYGYFSHTKKIISIKTDFEGFNEREISLFKALMRVPAGNIVSYGALARYALGNSANRYAGKILSRNRLQIIVPCHRVVRRNYHIGGFTSPLGVKLKILLLQNEGIQINNCKIQDHKLYEF